MAQAARRQPDAESARPDREPQGREELDRLAVDAGVERAGGGHLELLRRPRSPRRLAASRPVEHDDAEPSTVEGGAGPRRARPRAGVPSVFPSEVGWRSGTLRREDACPGGGPDACPPRKSLAQVVVRQPVSEA